MAAIKPLVNNIIPIFLIITCIFRLATVSVAQDFTTPPFTGGGSGSSSGGFGISGEFVRCFSSLLGVRGCGLAAFTVFISGGGESNLISRECCSAISRVSDDCWPKIFPMNPLISDELRTICRRITTV